MISKPRIAAGCAGLAGLALGAAMVGCNNATVTKTPTAAPPSSRPPNHQQSAPATKKAAAAPTSGPVGTTFTVHSTDSNGNPIAYTVTLLRFVPDATPDNSFDAAPTGKHLAGAEFKITGVQGVSDDDANTDTYVQGNDQQTYQSGFEGLADGTNFNAGEFHVGPGEASIGWVSYEVKDGVSVASVIWNPQAGFSSATATWNVLTIQPSPSPSSTSPAPTAASTAAPTPAPSAGSPTGIQAVTPWAVVSEYYGDIDSGDYVDAYALLSSGSVTGQTYQQFVSGFACTSYENLQDLGTTGDTVTISLSATQCDGSVKHYQGTYTVQNGLITAANIHQTG